jgi:hypothetical protein
MKAKSTQSRHTSTRHNKHSRQSKGPLLIGARAFALASLRREYDEFGRGALGNTKRRTLLRIT